MPIKDREVRNARNRERRALNREEVNAKVNAWRKANRDKRREQARRWRDKNREHVREKDRAWKRANRDKKSPTSPEYQKAWRAANPELVRRNSVKNEMARSIGVSMKIVPEELVDAKLAQLAVRRLVKQALDSTRTI